MSSKNLRELWDVKLDVPSFRREAGECQNGSRRVGLHMQDYAGPLKDVTDAFDLIQITEAEADLDSMFTMRGRD